MSNIAKLEANIAERREALVAAQAEIETAKAARDECLFNGTAEELAAASANLVAKTEAVAAIEKQIAEYEDARPEAKRRDKLPLWESLKAAHDEAKTALQDLNKGPNKIRAEIAKLEDQLAKLHKELAPQVAEAEARFVRTWFDCDEIAASVDKRMPDPPLYSLGAQFWREDVRRRPPSQFGVSRFVAYAPKDADKFPPRPPVAATFSNPDYQKNREERIADLKARGLFVAEDVRDVDQRKPGLDRYDVERNADAEVKARGGKAA